ncbi:hypothetical protein [Streptomyces sp. NPDC049881]|uniref:hypothetical protein n=1 Tax=Streptomyces sp. NPDC049881 TaxID=3155778 RepID=UPI0034399AAD
MTAEAPQPGPTVHRLLPSRADIRTVRFDDSLTQLKRWEFHGPPQERPSAFGAEWLGEPAWPKPEFPSTYPDAPVFSRRLAELLGPELTTAGTLLPLTVTDGGGAVDDEGYLVYVVDEVVDCVDTARSSRPGSTGEMQRAVFRPDALPTHLPAFRVPQFPVGIFWNGWFADRLSSLLGSHLESRLIWSASPHTPHPYPWGV